MEIGIHPNLCSSFRARWKQYHNLSFFRAWSLGENEARRSGRTRSDGTVRRWTTIYCNRWFAVVPNPARAYGRDSGPSSCVSRSRCDTRYISLGVLANYSHTMGCYKGGCTSPFCLQKLFDLGSCISPFVCMGSATRKARLPIHWLH